MPPMTPPIGRPGMPGVPENPQDPGMLQRLATLFNSVGKAVPGMVPTGSGGGPVMPGTPLGVPIQGQPGNAPGPPAIPGLPSFPGMPGNPAQGAPLGPNAGVMEGSPMASAIQQQSLQPGFAQFSGHNKWLKNLSVASSILQDVGNVVTQFKQKKWDSTRQTASGFMAKYIGLQQAINQPGLEPEQKKLLQEQAQQMVQDPKFQKAWEKAQKDPTSPESIGFGQAQKQAQDQSMTQLAVAKLQQEIQTEVARQQQAKAATAASEAATAFQKSPIGMGTEASAGQKLEAKTDLEKSAATTERTMAVQKEIATRQRVHDIAVEKMREAHDTAMSKRAEKAMEDKEAMQKRMYEFRRTMAAMEPTTNIKTRQQFAKQTLKQIPEIRSEIDQLEKQGKLGPVSGRLSDFFDKKGGFESPLYNKFRTDMSLFASGMAQAHIPGRAGVQAIELFNSMFGAERMTPNNLRAIVDAVQEKMFDYAAPLPGQPGEAALQDQVKALEGEVGRTGKEGQQLPFTPPAGAKVRDFTDLKPKK